MSAPAVIVCEGIDDAQFLDGLLLHRLGARKAEDLKDSRDDKDWYFRLLLGGQLRVCQAGSVDATLRVAGAFVRSHTTKPLRYLALCRDSDAIAPETCDDATRSIRNWTTARGAVDFQLHPLIWWCDDPADLPGVPNKQTLERLACAALRQVHPDRADDVQRWLDAEPTPAEISHKNHRLAHLAKWYADRGTAHFWRALWQEEAVASALESRLRTTGAWDAIEAITSAAPAG